jgi:hypothetical protein
MLEQCRGRHIGLVAFARRDPLGAIETAQRLAKLGCTYDASITIEPTQRRVIEVKSGARQRLDANAFSLGVFAAAAAFWAGAETVALCGFSSRAVYAYNEDPGFARGHLIADNRALSNLGIAYGSRLIGAAQCA